MIILDQKAFSLIIILIRDLNKDYDNAMRYYFSIRE